jgi:hypothetical protein
MLRYEFRPVFLSQFAQFIVPSEKPDNPEHKQANPDNLYDYQGHYRIKYIFKPPHVY